MVRAKPKTIRTADVDASASPVVVTGRSLSLSWSITPDFALNWQDT